MRGIRQWEGRLRNRLTWVDRGNWPELSAGTSKKVG